ncbi:hypothetical protein KsCSTR_44440 [Candidatus Kuenenia stuttgartiensis]|uniref:Uncharacterized protein n=1 Tax=Kuenenia stuttgartiensis TaxID=174633 RepID=Q1PWV7_KUEST|nr:hypothetical protein KsCSTR_44440 [Candidatus Kuenenia stuttgartiensis]CAJ71714.1 unknown protein [Candidatus Kuenenia stuttgartiensis]
MLRPHFSKSQITAKFIKPDLFDYIPLTDIKYPAIIPQSYCKLLVIWNFVY